MKTIRELPDGFVIHGMEPAWIAKRSSISAWYGHDGNLLDAEVISYRNQSRSIKKGTPLWDFAEREGKLHRKQKS